MHAPNASGRGGGKGRGGNPNQQRAPMVRSKGSWGGAREGQQENPPRGGHQEPEGGSLQALRAQEPDRRQTETRAPPEWRPRLTRAAKEGGDGAGNSPPSSARQRRAAGAWGGGPQAHHLGTPWGTWALEEDGDPLPQTRAQTARVHEGGDGPRVHMACGSRQNYGGTSLYSSMQSQSTACPSRRRVTPRDRQTGGRGRTARAFGEQADPGGRKRPTHKSACAPSAWYAQAGGRGPPKTG